MDLKLTGRVALVTGSTAGIGFAIARALASEGAHVCVNGRTKERVDAAVAAIRTHVSAAKVDGIAADFSSSAGAENVMSGVRLSRHYLAGMLEQNWGRILFISSESGSRFRRKWWIME